MVKSKKHEKVFFLIYDINKLITKRQFIEEKRYTIHIFFSSQYQHIKYIITFVTEKDLIVKPIEQTILLSNIVIAFQHLIECITIK